VVDNILYNCNVDSVKHSWPYIITAWKYFINFIHFLTFQIYFDCIFSVRSSRVVWYYIIILYVCACSNNYILVIHNIYAYMYRTFILLLYNIKTERWFFVHEHQTIKRKKPYNILYKYTPIYPIYMIRRDAFGY